MIQALRARAISALGDQATVTELEGGGIVAEAGPRRLLYSLAGLAEDLMDRMEQGLQAPGSP